MNKEILNEFYNFLFKQQKCEYTSEEIIKIGKNNGFIENEDDEMEAIAFFKDTGLIKEDEESEEVNVNDEQFIKVLPKDLIHYYFHEISNYPLLTKEEEYQLGKRIQNGDLEARNILCEHNLRLVVKMAKYYMFDGCKMNDLIQDGNIGLLKACEKYNPDLGFRFSTYATCWIKQNIDRGLADTGREIRIPVHSYDLLKKYKKLKNLYYSLYQENPSDDCVMSELNINQEKLDRIKKAAETIISYDRPINEQGDTLALFLTSNEDQIEDTCNSIFNKEEIKYLISSLTEKEKKIISMRFGFENDKTYTLEECGKELGVTRERIRQIEARAITKMRRKYIYRNNVYEKNDDVELLQYEKTLNLIRYKKNIYNK